MAARAYERGWPIMFQNGKWVYEDTGKPATDNRPCSHCDKMPTSEGHDPCLGYIPGIKAACCGHGKETGYQYLGGGLDKLSIRDIIEIDS